MKSERVYTEQEVAKIIERAVEHQEADARQGAHHGLTVGELERLGKEVGIAPEYLRRAAAEVENIEGAVRGKAGNTEKQVQAVRWIQGRLSEVEIESMFAEIKNHVGPIAWSGWWGRVGTVERLGRTYEWDDGSHRITLTDDGEGYTLRVFGSQFFNGKTTESVILSLWVALAVGGLPAGGIGEVHGVLWSILIITVACALSFAIVPRQIARQRARVEGDVEALADRAARILLSTSETPRRNQPAGDPVQERAGESAAIDINVEEDNVEEFPHLPRQSTR